MGNATGFPWPRWTWLQCAGRMYCLREHGVREARRPAESFARSARRSPQRSVRVAEWAIADSQIDFAISPVIKSENRLGGFNVVDLHGAKIARRGVVGKVIEQTAGVGQM